MRGTLVIFTISILLLIGAGIYIFFNTEEATEQPEFYCELAQLLLSTTSEGTGGAVAGAITIHNKSVKPCRLLGFPEIAIETDNGEPISTTAMRFQMSPEPFVLNKDMRAQAGFIWRNWCGENSDSPLFLRIKLPHYGEEFRVPMLDTAGNPTGSRPRCDSSASSSELSVGPIVEDGGSLFQE